MRKRFDTPEAECLRDPDEAEKNSQSSVRPKVDAYRGRVLIIDDSDDARGACAAMLEAHGFDVVVAQDGHEGIAFFRALHRAIDAVVLDLQMPGMDGLETFRRLKAWDATVRVVLCSGAVGDDRIRIALREGVVAFVAKPFQASELVEHLGRALERAM